MMEVLNAVFEIVFTFTYQETAVITLVDYFSHFSIYVNTSPDLHTQKDLPAAIRGEIHESIRAVAKCLQYSNLELKDAFMCPSHTNGNHVALWCRHGEKEYYGCTVQNKCTGRIPEEYQVWMENKGLLKFQSLLCCRTSRTISNVVMPIHRAMYRCIQMHAIDNLAFSA